MRSRVFVSLIAGLLTPLAIFGLLNALTSSLIAAAAPPLGSTILFPAVSLSAFAVALLPPIHPLIFGLAFIPAVPIWLAVLAGPARSGNLFGLALIFSTTAGVAVALVACLAATLARRRRLPAWTPAAPLLAGFALLALASLRARAGVDAETARLPVLLERIAAAEKDWAAAHPGRGFHCDGPDVAPIDGLDWRADAALGTVERNQAAFGHYWIRMSCDVSGRPAWFAITATPGWQGGVTLVYDSRTGVVKLTR